MINKVLAKTLYMYGLFDSKSIVKEIVRRKKQNKGGGTFINPRWRLYIYIYICIHHELDAIVQSSCATRAVQSIAHLAVRNNERLHLIRDPL